MNEQNKEYTIPGGDGKGTPLSEATEDDLIYWEGRIRKDIDNGKVEKKFLKTELARHAGFLDELERRGHVRAEMSQPTPPAAERVPTIDAKVEQQPIPSARAALATRPASALAGSYRDERKLNQVFETASKSYHLISPATSCPKLPEGCSVALSAIQVDIENETYYTGGKGENAQHGLSKSALQKISIAAGIAWDPARSGRTDDGSDPYYCAWQAVGEMRLFDGTKVPLTGNKVMDMREGSPQIQALWERYEAAKRDPNRTAKDPTAQIREMRLHIVSHAETKAQLRAIRSTGIRSSYKKHELTKPFLVARLMWTGETDDPKLREYFAKLTADFMIGTSRALYGSPTPPALPRNAPPPALGSTSVDENDLPGDDDL